MISNGYIKDGWSHSSCVGCCSLFSSISLLPCSQLGYYGIVAYGGFMPRSKVEKQIEALCIYSATRTLIKELIHNPDLRQTSIKLSWIMSEAHET